MARAQGFEEPSVMWWDGLGSPIWLACGGTLGLNVPNALT